MFHNHLILKVVLITPESLIQIILLIYLFTLTLNKSKDGDFECDDPDICEVLAYYGITREDTESN